LDARYEKVREGGAIRGCLRLARALCIETHENWIEAHRYLDMSLLREHKKQELMKLAV